MVESRPRVTCQNHIHRETIHRAVAEAAAMRASCTHRENWFQIASAQFSHSIWPWLNPARVPRLFNWRATLHKPHAFFRDDGVLFELGVFVGGIIGAVVCSAAFQAGERGTGD